MHTLIITNITNKVAFIKSLRETELAKQTFRQLVDWTEKPLPLKMETWEDETHWGAALLGCEWSWEEDPDEKADRLDRAVKRVERAKVDAWYNGLSSEDREWLERWFLVHRGGPPCG